MLKFIHIATIILFVSVSHIQSYEVTFRKNITVPSGEYFFLNHSYIKESQSAIIDYIDTVNTTYQISLTNSYDNTAFDVFLLNEAEFDCYLQGQESSSPGAVPPCSLPFLNSNQKSILRRTSVNGTIYSDKIEALAPPNSIIVIDNTQFPKSLNTAPYFLGAYQSLPINIDVYIKLNYELSNFYYQVYLACK